MQRPDPRDRASAPVLSFLLLLMLLAAVPSEAADPITVDVGSVYASNEGTSIDPALKTIREKLHSMFNYTSYRLLSSQSLNLQVGQSGMVSLPGNHRLKITPHQIHDSRADIALKMMKKRRTVFQTQVQLLNRGNLFVGGPEFLNGNLIFKISSAY